MILHKPVVAAFDFDGTITTRDTLLSFLFFVAGKKTTIRKLLKLTPNFILYLFKQSSRQHIKELILTNFFAGMPINQMSELGEAFAKSNAMKKLIRPDAKKKLEWHRRQKHLCILISASIDVYLEPWSILAGFDDLLCSKLEVDSADNVTGKLIGANCWGPQKKLLLDKLLGPRENYILYAYGDSRGDKEMLAHADHAFYRTVNE